MSCGGGSDGIVDYGGGGDGVVDCGDAVRGLEKQKPWKQRQKRSKKNRPTQVSAKREEEKDIWAPLCHERNYFFPLSAILLRDRYTFETT